MSKPLTKNQIATIQSDLVTIQSNVTMLQAKHSYYTDVDKAVLIAHVKNLLDEVARLQKLAKPHRKPTTRKPAKPYVARSNHEVLYD